MHAMDSNHLTYLSSRSSSLSHSFDLADAYLSDVASSAVVCNATDLELTDWNNGNPIFNKEATFEK